jgi:hypothetical protein
VDAISIDYSYVILAQNNTGPRDRARPVLQCYPAINEPFAKCIVASGIRNAENNVVPQGFYNDIWRMNIDLTTLSVQWEQLENETTLPIYSKGGYHLQWRKNATALSFTAALNDLLPPFNPQCNGDKLFTYDFKNRRYELTTPTGGNWANLAAGGCDRIGKDVYCFGGFNCTSISDTRFWSVYNIETNTFQLLNSANLASVDPRHHPEVSCNADKKTCYIATGDQFTGLTDQWVMYDKDHDEFETDLDPKNKPIHEQHIAIQAANTWKILSDGDFKVIDTEKDILMVGGGVPDVFTTLKDIRLYRTKSNKFVNLTAECLFEAEYQKISHIPRIFNDDHHDEGNNDNECENFIQFGGQITTPQEPFRMLNEVVLHRLCVNNGHNDHNDD